MIGLTKQALVQLATADNVRYAASFVEESLSVPLLFIPFIHLLDTRAPNIDELVHNCTLEMFTALVSDWGAWGTFMM